MYPSTPHPRPSHPSNEINPLNLSRNKNNLDEIVSALSPPKRISIFAAGFPVDIANDIDGDGGYLVSRAVVGVLDFTPI